MTHAKVELFDLDVQKEALYFKALGHPARLSILLFLADINTCYTGDISREIPLGRTTINQHLDELKKVGLIKGHTSGIKVKYCLNPDVIIEFQEILRKLGCKLSINSSFNCE